MNKIISILVLLIVGAMVISAVAPAITVLIHALTPLLLVAGVVMVAWHLVRYFTRQ